MMNDMLHLTQKSDAGQQQTHPREESCTTPKWSVLHAFHHSPMQNAYSEQIADSKKHVPVNTTARVASTLKAY